MNEPDLSHLPPIVPPIGASWEASTGAGDDVLHVWLNDRGIEREWRVTFAELDRMSRPHLFRTFGAAVTAVLARLELYRLAHQPGRSAAIEATAVADHANRKRLAQAAREAGL